MEEDWKERMHVQIIEKVQKFSVKYLTSVAILNLDQSTDLKNLINVIQIESCNYSSTIIY